MSSLESTDAATGAPSLHPYRDQLLDLAESVLDAGLSQGRPPDPDPAAYPEPLREERATFVTLRSGGQLRGCIGSVEARRPLVADVSRNAYAAAFEDPRFPPLTREERTAVDIKLEILTPMEPISFETEEELLARLEPGRDGLLLEAGARRGTFLPTVWESLPDPESFWTHLKRKAGLTGDFFSPEMVVWRYRTEVLP